jgi:outer membrane protein assembly factor BamB
MEIIPKNEKINKLQEIIQNGALFKTEGKKGAISFSGDPQKWIFNFRHICLKPEFLNLVAKIFWDSFEKDYPFQIAGQELGGVPLALSIALYGDKIGKPANGFIVRKSSKNPEREIMIEGEVTDDKIILIDDAATTGRSILHGKKIIEQAGKQLHTVFFLAHCGSELGLEVLKHNQINFNYLFNFSDFKLKVPDEHQVKYGFEEVWRFTGPDPNYYHVVPKSSPAIDEKNVYFGSDNGIFWALSQDDGSLLWKFNVGYPIQGKSIFSSPAIYKDLVYFGSYDGNVYALEKNTGKLKWKFQDADWVGSSPAIASDLGLLFIGLEFGLFKKRGGIAALNLRTGNKIWDYRMKEYVHCSPAYCKEKKLVAIGGEDHCVYMFDAKKGKLKWKFETGGSIKASFSFDMKRNLVLFGSFDHNLYALDINTGEIKAKFPTKDCIYSTPIVHEDNVYFTSTDKNLYSVNLNSGKINWRFTTLGRIFSSPEIVRDKILVGSNGGAMYEINIQTGKLISIFQTAESITNKIVYNPATRRYFVMNYTNELFCLRK